ncbi:U3 small nucleolar ribonucleoprotein IMP4 [Vairimorpha necatrix]|uniref:U3 small nucleolar ribonucleoprotein protein IMP4 n=1 Tax=Vairimorpha necatrix TaxID=6039 RepID=A0AAX4JBL2_9MICR
MLNRLRKKKEYLLKKENESRQKEIENKKSRLKSHLNDTERLSHDLKKDGKDLLDEIIYENDEEETIPYPKILVTTSKNPSSKLLEFTKHISLIFNGIFQMRGQSTKEEISDMMFKSGFTSLIMIHENKGTPSSLIISNFPYGNTFKFSISNYTICRTINLGEYCHLVCDKLNENLKDLFSKMLPRYPTSRRILALSNVNDKIGFRHYLINKGKRVELKLDLGCDLRLYEIRKGTFEQDGEFEWIYKPFINSEKSNIYNKTEIETEEN